MQDNETYVDNIKPCTIETIDYALFNWVKDKISPSTLTNEGFKKIPIIWASTERAFQIKNFKDLRDSDGTLKPPFISIERGTIEKDVSKIKGAFQANLFGYDRISYTKTINQEKTSKYANNSAYKATKKLNFALNKPKQVVYQTKSIRLPVYIGVEYTLSVKTNYLQQMNEILHPFLSFSRSTKHFLIEHDNFRFEAFMGANFQTEENASSLETEERQYITTLTVQVIGYLIGDGKGQDEQIIQTTENAVSIKLPKENIILEGRKVEPRKRQPLESSRIGETVTAIKKTFIIGNGTDQEVYTVTHNLNTRNMYVSVRSNLEADGYEEVLVSISYPDLNTISIDMGNPIGVDSHSVTIIG